MAAHWVWLSAVCLPAALCIWVAADWLLLPELLLVDDELLSGLLAFLLDELLDEEDELLPPSQLVNQLYQGLLLLAALLLPAAS